MNGIKRITLIIGGGIAAYKVLDLIRRLRERGHAVRCIMTDAAQQFVTPLSVGALTNERVFTNLFSLDDEREIGHIRLSRDCDLIVVAPATADLMAKMAGGHANDLATSVLLATDKPILLAPAMNPRMWLNRATQRNAAQLRADGVHFIGPAIGEMAERNEAGPGRLVEVPDLLAKIDELLRPSSPQPKAPSSSALPLTGRHVLITTGPTHEPIDPVRYIANRSSGKQGYALAAAAANLGATVTLISGPVTLPDPINVSVVRVTTAAEMLAAVTAALPADAAIFAAAVADWRVAQPQSHKLKKTADKNVMSLSLTENPDLLATIAQRKKDRPRLVIGFAAETENVIAYAKAKLRSKGADWIVANNVSPETNVLGGDHNTVHVIDARDVESWPAMSKTAVAEKLLQRVAEYFGQPASDAQ